MPRILAIEADSSRSRLLTALVREHSDADLLVVESVKSAIAVLAHSVPDLILAPTLLSQQDGADLIGRVKDLQAPWVQVMTVPALDMLAEPRRGEERRRFQRFVPIFGSAFAPMLAPVFGRKETPLGPQYDAAMVGEQIADALEQARAARAEHEARLAYRDELMLIEQMALVGPLTHHHDQEVTGDDVVRVSRRLRAEDDERRVSLRRRQSELPWLSAISLAWGTDVRLVNISSTGVLLETGSKLAPGSTTDLHLTGPETNLVVPVRFVRSDVARIDGLGVKYHAAATFAKEVDLSGPRPVTLEHATVPATPPQELAALFGGVFLNAGAQPGPAHARFAHGIRDLVGASDVQVRYGAVGGGGGRETLYFDVPGDDRTRRTLQVMFDRHHHVTEAQFKLLKAAAWLTAAVLELEAGESTAVALLSERVA